MARSPVPASPAASHRHATPSGKARDGDSASSHAPRARRLPALDCGSHQAPQSEQARVLLREIFSIVENDLPGVNNQNLGARLPACLPAAAHAMPPSARGARDG